MMKSKLILGSLILIILASTSVSALTRLNIYIDERGDALFLGTTNENIALPSGISLQNGRISGYTSGLTGKEGNLWNFSYSLGNSELSVILPEGAVIKNLESGEISLYKKQILIYNNNQVRVSYFIQNAASDSSTSSGIIFILIGIALVIITIYLTKRQHKKEAKPGKRAKKKVDRVSILSQVLNDRENLIIGKLKETGKVKSSHLRKMCDIPKASFSRHIRELEKKGLVKLDGEGKNKFVSLKR